MTMPELAEFFVSRRNNRRVLLIEDDPDDVSLMTHALHDDSLVIDHASSGEEGLRMLENNHYDLALVDIGLPGMDGVEVCDRILEHHSSTMVLVVTGADMSPKLGEALRRGHQVIRKPVTVEKIRELALRVSPH